MNSDRSVLLAGRNTSSFKYILPKHIPLYEQAIEYLSHIYVPEGFVYKDVVQPFVVSHWLQDNPDIPVLKILPNIPHVALSMLKKNWLYPTIGAVRNDGSQAMMIAGLVRAAKALESVPGETVSYDDLMFDLEPLKLALCRMYPDRDIPPLELGADFQTYRKQVLDRRESDDYVELLRLAKNIRDNTY